MTLILAILALSVLIIIHEFGHYLAARMTGMHVATFSMIGIGKPVLHLFKYNGTDFVISAIPFGAYVQIVGMEPEEFLEEMTDEEKAAYEANIAEAKERGLRNYRDAPAWARALTLAGGPLANYAAAMVLAVGVYAGAGINNTVAISAFSPDSAAQAAGLEEGDVYVKIGSDPVQGTGPASLVVAAGNAQRGETVDVTVTRDGEEVTVPVTLAEEGPALGTEMMEQFSAVPLGDAVTAGLAFPWVWSAKNLKALGGLITGKTKGRVGGPVQIVRVIKKAGTVSIPNFVLICAIISAALGLFNLLPIPALDGGRLVFIGIEKLRGGKPVDPVREANIHGWGMTVLLVFILIVTFGDIRAIFRERAAAQEQEQDQVEQKDEAEEKAEAETPADGADGDKAAKVAGEATPASASAGG